MRARHPTCKCGHSFNSHTRGGFGVCATGWPFKPTTCKCQKFRPRVKKER